VFSVGKPYFIGVIDFSILQVFQDYIIEIDGGGDKLQVEHINMMA
jgi:hypothetical protein